MRTRRVNPRSDILLEKNKRTNARKRIFWQHNINLSQRVMAKKDAAILKNFRSPIKSIWDEILENENPSMVFSILGDSTSFVPKAWPQSVFKAALIDSARNAGVSLVLHRNEGYAVSKILREADDERSCISNLDSKNTKKQFFQLIDINEKFSIDSQHPDQLEIETVFNENRSNCYVIEGPNIDGKQNFKMRIPILLVVLEGDLDTVKHVAQATERGLPVLLIKGTGKAADVIANFLDDESILLTDIPALFGLTFSRAAQREINENLRAIKNSASLVSIFDVENDAPAKMSTLAGDLIVKAWSLKDTFAIQENEDYFVKPIVHSVSNLNETCCIHVLPDNADFQFTPTKYMSPTTLPLYFYFGFQCLQKERDFSSESSQNLLISSLRGNRTDYVLALLDNGATLTEKQMALVYKQIACGCDGTKNCFHVAWILKKIHKKSAEKMRDGIITKEAVDKLCRKLLGYKKFRKMGFEFKNKVGPGNTEEENKAENNKQETCIHLLMWALLSNRKEMAFLLWREATNHLLTGLICTAILRKLQVEAALVKEHKMTQEIQTHADIFQKRCLKLIDAMYNEYPDLTIELMDDQQTVWSICTTPLQFAHENLMYDVVAHACAQKRLNNDWYGSYPHDITYFCSPRTRVTKHLKKMTTPIVKFLLHNLIFMVVLFGYSSHLLAGIGDSDGHWVEYCVYIWAFGDCIEELSLGILHSGKSYRGVWAWKSYFYDFWNSLDILSYVLVGLASVVKYGIESLDWARRIYTLSLLVMFLRFVQVFLINGILGPLLIMLKEMVKDLLYFLLIALVLITGVGVYYHANIWPNHSNILTGNPFDWRIWDILYYPYWQMYGETMIEFLEGKDLSDCTSNYTIWSLNTSVDRCPEQDPLVPVVAALYMMISNLLLVNLVIAMFSHTFNEVKYNSQRLWCYERYNVITDYKKKIPSPLGIPVRCVELIHWIMTKTLSCPSVQIRSLVTIPVSVGELIKWIMRGILGCPSHEKLDIGHSQLRKIQEIFAKKLNSVLDSQTE